MATKKVERSSTSTTRTFAWRRPKMRPRRRDQVHPRARRSRGSAPDRRAAATASRPHVKRTGRRRQPARAYRARSAATQLPRRRTHLDHQGTLQTRRAMTSVVQTGPQSHPTSPRGRGGEGAKGRGEGRDEAVEGVKRGRGRCRRRRRRRTSAWEARRTIQRASNRTQRSQGRPGRARGRDRGQTKRTRHARKRGRRDRREGRRDAPRRTGQGGERADAMHDERGGDRAHDSARTIGGD
jgi:hypothetical protein